MADHNERVPVLLIGGPYDGYEGISIHNQDKAIEPSGHHARECGVLSSPRYERVRSGVYSFVGYIDIAGYVDV